MTSSATNVPISQAPGFKLDRYELLSPLAEGGMASVWVARLRGRHGFEKLVAIKTILPRYADNPRFRKMFLDEADIASRIEHPNVAQVFDLGDERGILYLVMEYIDGDSLSKLNRACQKKGVAIPAGIVLRVLADACAGLHEAHELRNGRGAPLGVVHRDISPHNILVSTKGIVKLIDFGIVKVGRGDGPGEGETTESGTLKGKIQYMAPEQALGRPVDRRADVWAIGAILYHVLSGRAPYEGANQLAIMHLLGAGMPPLPLGPEVEPAVAAVAAKALAHDPAKRYATAAELREAIEHAMAAENLTTTSSQVSAFWAEHLAERAQRRRTAIENALAALTDRTQTEAEHAAALLVHPARTQTQSDPPTASYATLRSAALDTSGPALSFAKARKPMFTLVAIAAALGIVAATSMTVLHPKRNERPPAAAEAPAPTQIPSIQPAAAVEAPPADQAPAAETFETVAPLALPASTSPNDPDTGATGIRHKRKPKVEQ